ncbi:MAG: hypothetical protein KFH87_14965 [Bacteroidetes bacterium]|nr:hypothetical protein [Bacteroidota bacterium]
MQEEELRHTFDCLLHSLMTTRQLNHLVHRSIHIATGMLQSIFSRYKLLLDQAGYSIESAAARSIESMFLPLHGIPCLQLEKRLRYEISVWETRHTPDIITDGAGDTVSTVMPVMEEITVPPAEDCPQLLDRCVYSAILLWIPEMLGEFDPQFRKILRMVNETISKNPRYSKQPSAYDDVISRGVVSDENEMLPSLPNDELLARLAREASPTQSTASLLDSCFDILQADPDVRHQLSINSLVTVLRDLFHLHWRFVEEDRLERESANPFHQLDRELIIEPIVTRISDTILQSYVDRDIFDNAKKAHYRNAVRNMLNDLAEGRPVRWFDYHEHEFPDISYEVYREIRRSRFEYVLGNARELFILRCQKYFCGVFPRNQSDGSI